MHSSPISLPSWQTIVSLAIVIITLLLFLRGIWKRTQQKGEGGCSGGCGCKPKVMIKELKKPTKEEY
jgi:hypothetical protein